MRKIKRASLVELSSSTSAFLCWWSIFAEQSPSLDAIPTGGTLNGNGRLRNQSSGATTTWSDYDYYPSYKKMAPITEPCCASLPWDGTLTEDLLVRQGVIFTCTVQPGLS
ncbi:hypothetical protein BDV10DRAFT_176907 [Aspergillus recurvatus]